MPSLPLRDAQLALLALTLLGPPTCLAAGGDEAGTRLRPWVAIEAGYDDNLFRLTGRDEAREVLGDTDMGSWITRYQGGLEATIPIARQRLHAHLSASRNMYDAHGFLDHTAVEALGAAHWAIGRNWSGRIHGGYRRDLAPFEDFEQPIRDLRTMRTAGLDAARHLGPGRTLRARWLHRETAHDHAPRAIIDRNIDRFLIEVVQHSSGGPRSWAALRAEVRDVRFPRRERVDDLLIDNSHDEYEFALHVHWEATSRSTVEARAGHARVRHREFTARDFSGPVALLRLQYEVGTRLHLEAAARRDIDARTNTAASYVVTEAVEVGPTWQGSATFHLALTWAHERRRFDGDARLSAVQLARRDRVDIAALRATWEPPGPLSAHLAWHYEDLDSTRVARNYRYQVVMAGVRIGF